LADRDGDLAVLDGLTFDATLDMCAYFPRQVEHVVDALGARAGRYLLISSTSVYAEPARPAFDESSPTVVAASADVDAVTETTYGPLKVACEETARRLLGDRTTIVRPTYVVGPWDHTQRFTHWVRRLSEGGDVLGPGNASDPLQLIDARDLGRFVVDLVERDVAGTFHAVSPAPPYTFGDMLRDVLAVVAPSGTTITWVDQDWLLAQGESDSSIPLWGGGDPWILANAADPAASVAAGLKLRSVRQSAVEVLDHLRAGPTTGADPGMSREREAELLAAWRAR
jgi:2'-hydroxyisoflavone reductase